MQLACLLGTLRYVTLRYYTAATRAPEWSLIASSSALTWSPAKMGGYFASSPPGTTGLRMLSEAMCEKRVEEMRHNDRASSRALAMANTVLSFTNTSCQPATTTPPVTCSNCIPAWANKQPSGTDTGIFVPSRSQMSSPGNRLFPCTVKKLSCGDRKQVS